MLAALLAAVLTAGCGTTETSGGDTDTTTSPTPTATARSGEQLASDWLPQIRALDTATAVGDCQQPGSDACATAIADIMVTVDDLGSDLAGRSSEFPETNTVVEEMQNARDAYIDAGCDTTGGDGAGCYESALDVVMGPAELEMTLITDQPSVADD